jgi:transcriptional regulator with XRE-family HTH domain
MRENLRALRAKAGLSQRALAARLGVPHTWVAKVETGERRLDVLEFMEFTRACGGDAVAIFAAIVKQVSPVPTNIGRKGGR